MAREHRLSLILLSSVIIVSVTGLAWHYLTGGALRPKDVLDTVPIGIRLTKLEQYLQPLNLEAGDVIRCVDGSEPRRRRAQEAAASEPCPSEVNLGGYNSWNASSAERDQFSGRILFYSSDALKNYRVFQFTFVHGTLRNIDWGNLPG